MWGGLSWSSIGLAAIKTYVYARWFCSDGCTDPGAPAGGSASLVGATSYPSQPGSLVQFVCDEGLDLVGTDFTVCSIDLTWSNPVPTCERKCQSCCFYHINSHFWCLVDSVWLQLNEAYSCSYVLFDEISATGLGVIRFQHHALECV